MKDILRFGFILAIICIIAAGLLAVVNSVTRPKILEQAITEEQAALKEVITEAANFKPVKGQGNEILYYKAYDGKDKLIGFVFKASGKGYSSNVETLVGMFLDDRISAIKVISQNETPGLGVKITEEKFTGQFKDKTPADLSAVKVVSGATISSRAVINGITNKAKEIKELLKNAQ